MSFLTESVLHLRSDILAEMLLIALLSVALNFREERWLQGIYL